MKPTPLPSTFHRHSFSTAEALAAGVSPCRLRARDLSAPHRGVRTPAGAAADTALDRCRAFAPLLGTNRFFSHTTAAELWGLPVPVSLDAAAQLHVAAWRGREPRCHGVVGHRLDDYSPVELDGLPVVRPVDAWVQSSEVIGLDALVVMGDALLWRWSRHAVAREVPLDHLAEACAARAHRRGVVKLRDALDLVRVRVESPQETKLRLIMARAGLPEPDVNRKAFDDRGAYLGRPDLAYFDRKIAVEYEGEYHLTDPETWARDIRRRERFEDAGWRVVRVTKSDLTSGVEELVQRLRRRMDSRA